MEACAPPRPVEGISKLPATNTPNWSDDKASPLRTLASPGSGSRIGRKRKTLGGQRRRRHGRSSGSTASGVTISRLWGFVTAPTPKYNTFSTKRRWLGPPISPDLYPRSVPVGSIRGRSRRVHGVVPHLLRRGAVGAGAATAPPPASDPQSPGPRGQCSSA
eukprot:1182868-Prorocentrum_minimum.AAC.3